MSTCRQLEPAKPILSVLGKNGILLEATSVKEPPSPIEEEEEGLRLLYAALGNKDEDSAREVVQWLKAYPQAIAPYAENIITFLCREAWDGKYLALFKLFSESFPSGTFEELSNDGYTPLMVAVIAARLDVVKCLVDDVRVDVNTSACIPGRIPETYTALDLAFGKIVSTMSSYPRSSPVAGPEIKLLSCNIDIWFTLKKRTTDWNCEPTLKLHQLCYVIMGIKLIQKNGSANYLSDLKAICRQPDFKNILNEVIEKDIEHEFGKGSKNEIVTCLLQAGIVPHGPINFHRVSEQTKSLILLNKFIKDRESSPAGSASELKCCFFTIPFGYTKEIEIKVTKALRDYYLSNDKKEQQKALEIITQYLFVLQSSKLTSITHPLIKHLQHLPFISPVPPSVQVT